MITELFIEGNRVDISADISSLLTFAIDDLKNFATRQTAFSKTIVLPGTSTNNRLFGAIFETGTSNEYDSTVSNIGVNFNPSVSAKALLFQDNLQTFKGTVRMLEILNDKGRIEYEVALNGELTSLSVALNNYLDQLNFSAYNEAFTHTNIVASWDNPGGSGLYYPLLDVGNKSSLKHDWDIRTFRPALYAKEYIDKMFTAANFRYDCDLFNTSRFKKIIVPFNKKDIQQLSTPNFSASDTSLVTIVNNGDTDGNFKFNVFSGTGFSIDGATEIITYLPIASADFTGNLQYTVRGINTSFSISTVISVTLEYNGTVLRTDAFRVNLGSHDFSLSYPFSITLNQNDTLKVVIRKTSTNSSLSVKLVSALMTATTSQLTYNEIVIGDTLIVNDSIPKNIKQVEFLTSIIKLFNLYVYESPFDDRLIYIKPYVDFYSEDSGNAVDWTYKLNRDTPVRIKPLSEITSKTYIFTYKDDNDFFNDLYKKRYNQTYGSHIFNSNFEFASQENKCELIFSPTLLVGYNSEDKVYSTIFKKSGSTEDTADHNVRLLQSKKITGVTSWDIKNGVTVLSSQTVYGYAGHLDDPDNPTNDLNFGVPKELFFTLVTGDLTTNQFNVYWSPYMAEITDKDSKLFTGRFYLTPRDIAALDFSKYVHVDGVIYRLMKINDYNASMPSDCEVQLLKVVNTLY